MRAGPGPTPRAWLRNVMAPERPEVALSADRTQLPAVPSTFGQSDPGPAASQYNRCNAPLPRGDAQAETDRGRSYREASIATTLEGAKVALILLTGLAGVGAVAPPEPQETVRAILHGERYQTALPKEGAPRSAGDVWPFTGRSTTDIQPPAIPIPTLPAGLLWVLVLAAVAVGLAFLLQRLPWPAPPPHEPLRSPKTSVRAGAEPVQIDPETLARAGLFAAAIHALLLRALIELGRRAGSGSAVAVPSSTSREILSSAAIAATVRTALGPLVAAVERVHFGGGSASIEDYSACLDHYRRFRDTCR